MFNSKSLLALSALVCVSAVTSGCYIEGNYVPPPAIRTVEICSTVLNCEFSSAGNIAFSAQANGTPILLSSNSAYGTYGPTRHDFYWETDIAPYPNEQTCVSYDMTVRTEDGYGGSERWAYDVYAYSTYSVSYLAYDDFDASFDQVLLPTVESIDFGGADGRGGRSYVTFDCNNPNGNGELYAQVEKAVLKKTLKDIKGGIKGILPESIFNGGGKSFGGSKGGGGPSPAPKNAPAGTAVI